MENLAHHCCRRRGCGLSYRLSPLKEAYVCLLSDVDEGINPPHSDRDVEVKNPNDRLVRYFYKKEKNGSSLRETLSHRPNTEGE